MRPDSILETARHARFSFWATLQKWLNAGVIEEGEWSETKTGSPQGSVISPLLANIYL